jgi:CDP-glucose 4,6-dehydratase
MKYLITGHTGFKGSWLSALLKFQGHDVFGVSLPPEKLSLFNFANISQLLNGEYYVDISKQNHLNEIFKEFNPDVLIHLAAQPLIVSAFSNPIATFETNLIGTLNVLEASKYISGLRATLIVTTDKVYKSKTSPTAYLETDALGGDDPYSASKSAADIASQSWRKSYGTSPISIARAGNVLGGGDWAKNRIMPDIIRALKARQSLRLRNPSAVRPWQHVLDCLQGYLLLIEKQLNSNIEGEWNFGPQLNQSKTVLDLVNCVEKFEKYTFDISIVNPNIRETETLLLDSSRSRRELGWQDKLDFENTVSFTLDWYKSSDPSYTMKQIQAFLAL